MKAQQLVQLRETRIQELESLLAASAVADAVPVPISDTDITVYATPVTIYGKSRSVEAPPGFEFMKPVRPLLVNDAKTLRRAPSAAPGCRESAGIVEDPLDMRVVAGARFRSGVSAVGEPTLSAFPGEEAVWAHAATVHVAAWWADRPSPRITNLILEERVPEEKIVMTPESRAHRARSTSAPKRTQGSTIVMMTL
eukprot:918095-Heterocapsa_arctica.AAC.1